MTVNPAALSALAKGDMDNFFVAAAPGGIEAQEKAGQTALVASTNMPKKMRPSREAFEKLGFVFGDAVDDLFVSATLPAGWTRAATDHSMHSSILDEQGRERIGVFYKAAFYDRKADAYIRPRFSVERDYPDGEIADNTLIATIVTDAKTVIHQVGMSRYLGDYLETDRLYEEGQKWLDENRPGWRDPVASWDIQA
jgi:hypothetical protein